VQFSAVSQHLFALVAIPAAGLSRRSATKMQCWPILQGRTKISPSPGGEGWGEGEHYTLFFDSSLRQISNMPSTERARSLRKKATWAEKLVWSWLRDRRFSDYKFRRNFPCGKYFLDFFCHEAHLSIELDGGGHGFPGQRLHDNARKRYLASVGIKELRFWNYRLRREKDAIRDKIFQELQNRAPHPLPDYTRPISPVDIRIEKQY
jgi:very-short-patch-repair endonuclease